MKLKDAIEIKQRYQYVLPKESCPGLIEADNLSIKALKRIDTQRIGLHENEILLLPGETKS